MDSPEVPQLIQSRSAPVTTFAVVGSYLLVPFNMPSKVVRVHQTVACRVPMVHMHIQSRWILSTLALAHLLQEPTLLVQLQLAHLLQEPTLLVQLQLALVVRQQLTLVARLPLDLLARGLLWLWQVLGINTQSGNGLPKWVING